MFTRFMDMEVEVKRRQIQGHEYTCEITKFISL